MGLPVRPRGMLSRPSCIPLARVAFQQVTRCLTRRNQQRTPNASWPRRVVSHVSRQRSIYTVKSCRRNQGSSNPSSQSPVVDDVRETSARYISQKRLLQGCRYADHPRLNPAKGVQPRGMDMSCITKTHLRCAGSDLAAPYDISGITETYSILFSALFSRHLLPRCSLMPS